MPTDLSALTAQPLLHLLDAILRVDSDKHTASKHGERRAGKTDSDRAKFAPVDFEIFSLIDGAEKELLFSNAFVTRLAALRSVPLDGGK